jgi:hypothetical protein
MPALLSGIGIGIDGTARQRATFERAPGRAFGQPESGGRRSVSQRKHQPEEYPA